MTVTSRRVQVLSAACGIMVLGLLEREFTLPSQRVERNIASLSEQQYGSR